MKKVKIFESYNKHELEIEMNNWMKKNECEIDIFFVRQSVSSDSKDSTYLIISIWYEEI